MLSDIQMNPGEALPADPAAWEDWEAGVAAARAETTARVKL